MPEMRHERTLTERRIVPVGSNPVFLTYGYPRARALEISNAVITRLSHRLPFGPGSRQLLHPSWLPKCSDEGFLDRMSRVST